MMARTLTPAADSLETGGHDTGEFELVMGRRQMASVAFLVLVLLAVCTGGSYLIGKGIATASAASLPWPIQEDVPEPPPPVALPAEPAATAPAAPDKPLFADPIKGVIYIQMGAVEKGIAAIIAEGLRRRAFESFVAPGPNDHIFRVLIGPFHSDDEYRAAKSVLDNMGLNSFAQRFEQ